MKRKDSGYCVCKWERGPSGARMPVSRQWHVEHDARNVSGKFVCPVDMSYRQLMQNVNFWQHAVETLRFLRGVSSEGCSQVVSWACSKTVSQSIITTGAVDTCCKIFHAVVFRCRKVLVCWSPYNPLSRIAPQKYHVSCRHMNSNTDF